MEIAKELEKVEEAFWYQWDDDDHQDAYIEEEDYLMYWEEESRYWGYRTR